MSVAVMSAWNDDMSRLAGITWHTKKLYCQRHGYDLIRGEVQGTRQATWSKLSSVHNMLSRYEAILWTDCDSLITGDADVIELLDDKDFAITLDIHGINAGVWIMRNTEWCLKLLQASWDDHERWKNHGWQDQMGIGVSLQTLGMDKVKFHPQRVMNSYPMDHYLPEQGWSEGQWEPGDFILHLPGMTNSRRIETLVDYGLVGLL